jgi:hypothetical protein
MKDQDTHEIVISASGTRHVRNNGTDRPILHTQRISALCGFGVKPEEELPPDAAVRDCPFCAAELRNQKEGK